MVSFFKRNAFFLLCMRHPLFLLWTSGSFCKFNSFLFSFFSFLKFNFKFFYLFIHSLQDYGGQEDGFVIICSSSGGGWLIVLGWFWVLYLTSYPIHLSSSLSVEAVRKLWAEGKRQGYLILKLYFGVQNYSMVGWMFSWTSRNCHVSQTSCWNIL